MPRRALIPLRWLRSHVRSHPERLAATSLAMLLASVAFLGFALHLNLSASRSADVSVCRQVNELRRDIYIAARDLGVQPIIAERFLPTENCERLP